MDSVVRRGFSAILLLIVSLAFPSLMHAAETGEELAAEEVRIALEKYEAGAFLEAAERFEKAYALSGRSIQLRNAARAMEKGGDQRRALAIWVRYSALSDLGPADRQEAEAEIARLQGALRPKVETPPDAAAGDPSLEAPPESSATTPVIPGTPRLEPASGETPSLTAAESASADDGLGLHTWLLVGGGVAGLLSGGIYGVAALDVSSYDRALAMRDGNGRIVGIDADEADRRERRIRTERTTSLVFGVLAVGLVVAGVAVGVSSDSGPDSPSASAREALNVGIRDGDLALSW